MEGHLWARRGCPVEGRVAACRGGTDRGLRTDVSELAWKGRCARAARQEVPYCARMRSAVSPVASDDGGRRPRGTLSGHARRRALVPAAPPVSYHVERVERPHVLSHVRCL